MPASITGYLIPSSFVSGVLSAGGDDILNGLGKFELTRGSRADSLDVREPQKQVNERADRKSVV